MAARPFRELVAKPEQHAHFVEEPETPKQVAEFFNEWPRTHSTAFRASDRSERTWICARTKAYIRRSSSNNALLFKGFLNWRVR
ncbi:hypothetical protein GGE66_000458 [Rhizobium leguminosarum]|uniref:Uncharacterized protein n=1 Tax=Rhizobium leguminosarum TaxID=384 RepID=A0A7W9ZQB2_RHILE|nr:hypothetical protein [Rhizobium leguminosarum]